MKGFFVTHFAGNFINVTTENATASLENGAVASDAARALFQELSGKIQEYVQISPEMAKGLVIILGTIGLIVLAFLANWVVRVLLVRVMEIVFRKSREKWLDALIKAGVFRRLSHFAAALVYTHLGHFVFCETPVLHEFLGTVVNVYIVGIIVAIVIGVLNALHAIATRTGFASGMPLGGVAQALKLTAYFLGFVCVLSLLLDKSPVYFLSGLGALSAVLLLVFKDALLGLVGGIMLAANRMVVVGDWIEMPKYGADGDVIDVSLTTVKVQNWDKTIVTVPCYSLISESFKNWRGMFEYGGRRIKRSIYIDMQSIHFADDALLARWEGIALLKEYLKGKREELAAANAASESDHAANRRQLTNVGTFRAYCLEYLRAHPLVQQDMLIIVRQLAPDEHGLPIELYLFSRDTRWVAYENLQSDIFDHLLAIIGEFGLRVYQQPSSNDIQMIAEKFLRREQ